MWLQEETSAQYGQFEQQLQQLRKDLHAAEQEGQFSASQLAIKQQQLDEAQQQSQVRSQVRLQVQLQVQVTICLSCHKCSI